jgi:alanine dehydrogenase
MPDGVMQRIRVASANGIGIKYMAREDAGDVAIIGSGWQAGTQLMAACAVRDIKTIRCFSPTKANRETFAREMSALLGVPVTPVDSPEAAVKHADIVMCASNTIEPIFFERWVEPGMHISSIKRPEIESNVLKRANVLLLHSHDPAPQHLSTKGVVIPEATTDRGWMVASDLDFDATPTLPEAIAGQAQGRAHDEQVTCFVNNVGLGYQFAAVGSVVHRKAREANAGHDLPTDWFTEDVHP